MTDVSSLFDLIRLTHCDKWHLFAFSVISGNSSEKKCSMSLIMLSKTFSVEHLMDHVEVSSGGNRCDQPVKPNSVISSCFHLVIDSLSLSLFTWSMLTCAHETLCSARDVVASCLKQWELRKIKWFVMQAKQFSSSSRTWEHVIFLLCIQSFRRNGREVASYAQT